MGHIEQLRTQGFAVMDSLTLSPGEVAEVNAFLLSRPVYVDAHVPQTSRNLHGRDVTVPREAAAASECVCVATADAVTAPLIFERGLGATDLAAAYLGRDPPVAFSINAFWTRPGTAAIRTDIQAFHRDADDVRFLAMFFYLNDVLSDDDGPHDLEGPDGIVRTVYGPAGTAFLADTSLPHRGRKPVRGERGMAWYRFGVSDHPPAGVWDKIQPVPASAMAGRLPADERLRKSVELLVAR